VKFRHFLATPPPSTPSFRSRSSLTLILIVFSVRILLIDLISVSVKGQTAGQRSLDQLDKADQGSAELMRHLRDIATKGVESDPAFLGEPRFGIGMPAGRYFYYDTPFKRAFVFPDSDLLAIPMEALVRATVFRRDFEKVVPKEPFWKEPLGNVLRSIESCVEDYAAFERNERAGGWKGPCADSIQSAFLELGQSVQRYANAHSIRPPDGLDGRSPAEGYEVTIIVSPPRARVKIMTALEYLKCGVARDSKSCLEREWIDQLSDKTNLIGEYRYRVEWPADLNGPDEGHFGITKRTTLTFTPNKGK